ncbi:MAG TPA: ATP-binding protein [Bryobacteraceae bacterium]
MLSDVVICVVSESPDSYSPLNENNRATLIRFRPGEPVPQADLYVWDYWPGIDLQALLRVHETAQHLILAEAKMLDEIGRLSHSACILLKPVSAFTLRAFVELAEKAWELRQQAREAETLRLDRDALLQYVLEVNLKLQEYDQERSNFLARAIHDFRAPLTALHGYCGLLAEGKLGGVNAGQQELLERMRYSTRRLTRLAGGTLELLTHGRVNRMPDRRPNDIEDVLDQALHDVYPFLQDKQIEIEVQMEPVRGALLFEEEQIVQVLMNLLENSTKFTPKDGRIEVRGYPVRRSAWTRGEETDPEGQVSERQASIGDGYRVDIFDTGPGVSPHLCEKIFEQYASYGGPNDRSGGGLGLAICRAIILAHGGAIWASPSQEGGRFSFVLPATIAAVQSESTTYSSLQLA